MNIYSGISKAAPVVSSCVVLVSMRVGRAQFPRVPCMEILLFSVDPDVACNHKYGYGTLHVIVYYVRPRITSTAGFNARVHVIAL